MFLRLILILTFVSFSTLFSIELNCPYGCCTQDYDSDLPKIGKRFSRCLKKIGFYEETDCGGIAFQEDDDQSPDFEAASRYYEEHLFGDVYYFPSARISWEYDFGSLEYAFEDYLSHSLVKKIFTFESFSESVNAFSLLRENVSFYSEREAEYFDLLINQKNREIEALKNRHRPGWLDPYLGIDNNHLRISFKNDITKYEELQSKIETEKYKKLQLIGVAESDVNDIYKRIFRWCFENHHVAGALYHHGMISFKEGDFSAAFFDVKELIKAAEIENSINELKSEIFLLEGQLSSELGLYQNAITALCQAIEKDPNNIDAQSERASAYFEAGQWDLALTDYLNIKTSVDLTPVYGEMLIEFSKGLSTGAAEGFLTAANDLIPALMTTTSGAGNLLWAGICDPLRIPQKLSHAIYELFQYLSKTDLVTIAQTLEPEAYQLISEWDQLNDHQKGDLSGKIIGKYGFNILSGAALVKGVHAVKSLRELKKANQLFTLEIISAEGVAKQQILEKSSQLQLTRAEAIKKLKDDQDFLKSFRDRRLDETTVRRILHETGYQTFKRPAGLPSSFTVHFSEKGCGMVYFDPKNLNFHDVRVMPGNLNSPHPCQQKAYIKYKKDGKYRDKNGNPVSENSIESHIPVEEFIFKNE